MNVALFASAFHPSLGGVEELVRQLAHIYPGKGAQPIVITNRWPRTLPAYEEYEGIPLYRIAMRVPEGGLKARANYALTHSAIRRSLRRILTEREIELLHVQCVSSNGYYALLAKHALNLPLVVTTQGERTMDATGLYRRSAFMNRVLRQLLMEADYITACSRHTLDDMEGYFGAPFGDRAGVIYNGIETRDFLQGEPYAHPRPYVLGIGRMVAQKGFDTLVRAFAQADMPGYDLLLAGDGEERPALQTLTTSLGLNTRVHFSGRADRSMAVALFKGCAFFALPSRQEPFGIVNLEAMAASKAVVATRVGGVPEIVQEGQTGLLVPPDDPDALAAALTRLATDSALRCRLADAGRERAQQFTWSAIAGQYLEVYRRVQHRKSTG